MNHRFVTTALFTALCGGAYALPAGESVAAGAATFDRPDANTLNITQSSGQAILDWTSFNLTSTDVVNFIQPGATSLAINRIGGGASTINGTINANGQVWLLNANGLLFGNTSSVNVGSLMATTGTLTNPGDLGSAALNFSGAAGSIVNNGTLTAADEGSVLLIAPTVTNNGTVNAPTGGGGGGQIVLAAATAFTLDPATPQPLLTLSATPANAALTVNQAGTINTDGGTIRLTTQGVNSPFAGAVNHTGITRAQTVSSQNGLIVLGGAGTTQVNMAGTTSSGGGNTQVQAGTIAVASGATMATGGGGTTTLTGATTLGGTLDTDGGNLTQTGNVTLTGNTTIQTGGGNLNVGGTIDGARTLAVNTGTGNQTYTGAVGGGTALTAFTTTGGTTQLAAATTTGSQNHTATALTLNGNLASTGGGISLNGPVTLPANRSLTAGTNITVNGTLNNPARTLNLTAPGTIMLTGGATLNTLVLAGMADLILGGTFSTTGAMNFSGTDDLTLSADTTLTSTGAITFTAGNLLTGAGFALALNGTALTLPEATGLATLTATGSSLNIGRTITTSGGQTYTGTTTLAANLTTGGGPLMFASAVTLGGATQLQTTGGNIGFNSTLNGAQALTANAGNGTTTFTGAVGGGTQLASLNVTAANIAFQNTLRTSGNTTLAGNTSLQQATTGGSFTNTGATTLHNSITAGDNITLAGPVTLEADSTLTNGGAAGESITVTGNVGGGHVLEMVAGAGSINFTGNIDVDTLTFTSAGNFNYSGGMIEADHGLNFTNIGNINLAGDTRLIGGNTSTGTRGNIVSAPGNTILATNPGVDLFIYGNNVTLYQIGNPGTGILESLTVDAGVATLLAPIYTTGNQTITASEGLAGLLSTNGGDVVLNTRATLVDNVTILTQGGNVYFNNELNGAKSLTVDAGTGRIYLNAALGGDVALTDISFTASEINLTSAITTTGNQVYAGATNLGSPLTFTSGDITYYGPVNLTRDSKISTLPGGGNIAFNNTLDGAHTLTLETTTGGITTHGAVGAGTRLNGLNILTDSGNVTFLQGAHAQAYTQHSNLAGATRFAGTGLTAESIFIDRPATITGRLNGGGAIIQAVDAIVATVDLQTLSIASARTRLGGRLGGSYGRAAARKVNFLEFLGGPHTWSSYALPIVDDFWSPPTMAGSPFTPAAPFGWPAGLLPDGNLGPNTLYPWAEPEENRQLLTISLR